MQHKDAEVVTPQLTVTNNVGSVRNVGTREQEPGQGGGMACGVQLSSIHHTIRHGHGQDMLLLQHCAHCWNYLMYHFWPFRATVLWGLIVQMYIVIRLNSSAVRLSVKTWHINKNIFSIVSMSWCLYCEQLSWNEIFAILPLKEPREVGFWRCDDCLLLQFEWVSSSETG